MARRAILKTSPFMSDAVYQPQGQVEEPDLTPTTFAKDTL
jgi:hypothetical protein